jgi:hypothetical protein
VEVKREDGGLRCGQYTPGVAGKPHTLVKDFTYNWYFWPMAADVDIDYIDG